MGQEAEVKFPVTYLTGSLGVIMLQNVTRGRTASRNTHFTSIQMLRGIAALMVVLFHLVNAEVVHGRGASLLGGSLAEYGYGGVDLFFVISGFVMTTVMAGRFGSTTGAVRFLAKRGLRILPLYWLFTTAIVLLLLVRPGAVDGTYHDKSILASYLLLPQPTLPLLQVGWTLIYEAFFYLMMALAIALVSERRVLAFFAAWTVALLAMQLIPGDSPVWLIVSSPMGWEFIFGALIGMYWRRLPARLAAGFAITGGIGFAAGAVLLQMQYVQGGDAALTRTIAFGLPSALLLTGLVRWERADRSFSRSVFLLVGDASYSIYLSHLFVLSIGARLWSASGWNESVWQHCAFILGMMIACVVGGLICHRWIEKPLLNTSKAATRRLLSAAQSA
ncbi:MAG: acyltransferase family protein [Stenotrophomonas sp.]|uniref:acyltransferase family protein n=1 Tax=Stenotrophomonas sp. TaxID=69392 RepID=UPI003D6D9ADE